MSNCKRAWRFHLPARFFLLVAAIFWLSGCLRHDPPADLTLINKGEPESLDPQIITGQAEMRIVEGMFEGLMRLDPKTARAIPGLAERYELSPDGKTYTFHLRTNLVWSTGEPILAEDVVYSWIRALSPATASEYAGQLYYIKNGEEFNNGKITDPRLVGVHALDAHTLRVELKQPTAFFLDLCAFPTLYVVPRRTIEKYGDAWIMARPLPSSGPFELVDWRLNDKVRLLKNPRYWDAANTKSELIDVLPFNFPSTAFNVYEQGRADIVWDKELVPSELLDVLLRRPDFHTFNYLGTVFLRFNVTRKPFDDERVRRALGMAVDRERIVKKITKSGEPATTSLVPPGTANYHPVPGLEYNPAAARKLLAEAGYPGGKGFPRFDALVYGIKMNEDIGVELQQMWLDNLGLNMELRPLEWKVYLSTENHLDYDISLSDWIGDYNDAQTFLGMFTSGDGNNHTGWKNSGYDTLINAAGEQPDLAAREKTFQQAETLLVHESAPIVPIYNYVGVNYYDPKRIRGIYANVLDDHPLRAIQKIVPAALNK
jgi:oligopeptide transport system substrate-binding protein